MQYIVEDIYKLFAMSNTQNITISTNYLNRDDESKIFINDKGIYLITYRKDFAFPPILVGYGSCDYELRKNETITLGKKTLSSIKSCHIDYELCSSIIENYETIRDELLQKVNASSNNKDNKMKIINDWYNSFKKEAFIEKSYPKTNNIHEIEVIEDDGKTIGIINFGDKAIKIITTGDITLKRKEKEPTARAKQKI